MPERVWERPLGEIVAGPVNWGSELFVLVREKNRVCLYMLEASTGEILDKKNVDGNDRHWIGASNARVVVVSEKMVRCYRKGDSGEIKVEATRRFRQQKLVPTAVISDDFLVVVNEDGAAELLALDSLNMLAKGSLPPGPMTWSGEDLMSILYSQGEMAKSTKVQAIQSTVAKSVISARIGAGSETVNVLKDVEFRGGQVIRAIPYSFTGEPHTIGWWVPLLNQGAQGGSAPALSFQIEWSERFPTRMAVCPVSVDGRLIGQDAEGGLWRGIGQGKSQLLLPAHDLPQGAQTAAASCAQDVLYLGNWAFDLADASILWVLPDLKSTSPLIPLPGERFLVVREDDTLEAWGNSYSSEEFLADAASSAQDQRHALPPELFEIDPTRPGDGPGVILIGGLRLPGVVESRESDRVEVSDESGELRWTLNPEWVAWVEGDVASLTADGEVALMAAWGRFENWMLRVGLDQMVERFDDVKMPDECKRLIREAEARGMTPDQIEPWRDAASRVVSTSGRSKKWGSRAFKFEAEIRREWYGHAEAVAEFAANASAWGVVARVTDAAVGYGVHLQELARLREGDGEVFTPIEAKPMDPDAPAALAENRFLWREWASRMPSMGAQFIAHDDARRQSWLGTSWESAIAVETDHIVMLSRSNDAQLILLCLENAEYAVRLLDMVFQVDGSKRDRKMEVRVFESRDAFLGAPETERNAVGEWAAGYYSPAEQVSRFFVPDTGDRFAEGRDALVLNEVMVHEVTHQFIAERWLNRDVPISGPARSPGYWIAEGFATFIENQARGVLRRGVGLNDERTVNLDMASRLLAIESEAGGGAQLLFPLDQLLDSSAVGFHSIPSVKVAEIQLRQRSGRMSVTARQVYYEQAAALVYFLFHESKAAGREVVIDYLRRFYLGKMRPESWRVLGYESVTDLDREFREFLERVNRSW